jgi:hypothetical protein
MYQINRRLSFCARFEMLSQILGVDLTRAAGFSRPNHPPSGDDESRGYWLLFAAANINAESNVPRHPPNTKTPAIAK